MRRTREQLRFVAGDPAQFRRDELLGEALPGPRKKLGLVELGARVLRLSLRSARRSAAGCRATAARPASSRTSAGTMPVTQIAAGCDVGRGDRLAQRRAGVVPPFAGIGLGEARRRRKQLRRPRRRRQHLAGRPHHDGDGRGRADVEPDDAGGLRLRGHFRSRGQTNGCGERRLRAEAARRRERDGSRRGLPASRGAAMGTSSGSATISRKVPARSTSRWASWVAPKSSTNATLPTSAACASSSARTAALPGGRRASPSCRHVRRDAALAASHSGGQRQAKAAGDGRPLPRSPRRCRRAGNSSSARR